MHTAYALKASMFEVEMSGLRVEGYDWLDWAERDRLGIIVRSPVGALGASLLAMLSIVAFYDWPGKKRRARPIYPDLYMFHVGGRWGSHTAFDFWPERKEIFLPDAPNAILQSINDIGITHLLLPDRPAQDTTFRYKERETALDRLKQCYLYAPDGQLDDADLILRSREPVILKMHRQTLFPEATLAYLTEMVANDKSRPAGTASGDDVRINMALYGERLSEIDPGDPAVIAARARLEAAEAGMPLEERFRRIAPDAALDRIG